MLQMSSPFFSQNCIPLHFVVYSVWKSGLKTVKRLQQDWTLTAKDQKMLRPEKTETVVMGTTSVYPPKTHLNAPEHTCNQHAQTHTHVVKCGQMHRINTPRHTHTHAHTWMCSNMLGHMQCTQYSRCTTCAICALDNEAVQMLTVARHRLALRQITQACTMSQDIRFTA